MIATIDDIVTCEKGHPLYRVAPDYPSNSGQTLAPLHPRLAGMGTHADPRCPICGKAWLKTGPAGISIHFEDGWR